MTWGRDNYKIYNFDWKLLIRCIPDLSVILQFTHNKITLHSQKLTSEHYTRLQLTCTSGDEPKTQLISHEKCYTADSTYTLSLLDTRPLRISLCPICYVIPRTQLVSPQFNASISAKTKNVQSVHRSQLPAEFCFTRLGKISQRSASNSTYQTTSCWLKSLALDLNKIIQHHGTKANLYPGKRNQFMNWVLQYHEFD